MSTILISALTAAVVTLGIEFFAKPSLEARKDRILERHRNRRSLRTHLGALGFRHGQVNALLEDPDADPVQYRTDEVQEAITQHLDALVQALATSADYLTDRERDALSSYAALWTVYVYLRDREAPADTLARVLTVEIDPLDELIETVFTAPRWQWRARRRAADEITAIAQTRVREHQA